jgi:DNA-directed RNA polymerase subunit RPC12/RpoP
MKKIKVRCWKEITGCVGEHQQPVYFTVSDFYAAFRLYVCPKCGALFAVDPEAEHYSKRNFEEERSNMECPQCQNSLSNLLPYPDNYRNELTGEIEHFEQTSRLIPSDDQSIILEFWNPIGQN